ncbi:2001_t:CDS:1, partial [Gigaspora margarita]
MKSQETTTTNTTDLLDYYLEELTEMEQYFHFDENIAESSTQALFTSKGKEVEEVPTNQIHADSKEYNNDDMLVNKIMKL